MTKSILIGKGRRVTLEELKLVSVYDGTVELQRTNHSEYNTTQDEYHKWIDSVSIDKNAVSPALSHFDLEDNTSSTARLSSSVSVACLILLANTMAQNRDSTSDDFARSSCTAPSEEITKLNVQTSQALVLLINHLKICSDADMGLCLSTKATDCIYTLADFFPSHLAHFVNKTIRPYLLDVLERILPMAIASIASILTANFTKHTILDALASLSVERTLIDSSTYFPDVLYDANRPHRGMITSASVLRVCTQSSKFATSNPIIRMKKDYPDETKRAVQTIPQCHGPSCDSIAASLKVLELECNCFGSDLNNTVLVVTIKTMLTAVTVLMTSCLARMGKVYSPSVVGNEDALTLALKLEVSSTKLKLLLEEEARKNCSFILEQAESAANASQMKQVERDMKAASITQPTSEDNFDGLTEAQIAKILKKRAEKEAKAAQKAAKKKESAAGGTTGIIAAGSKIFGVGTMSIVSSLTKSNHILTPVSMNELHNYVSSLLSGGMSRKPKIPKGTRDYLPDQMMIRDSAFQTIRRVFKSHGAVEIDTPVFELKETLTGKYGEDSKLIYDLADQGGELLALRYDLTVPFARFLALNSVGNIKRFHIGKVYRRDQPALSRGRYREFYQCDFDIAGTYGRMVPDAECLCVASEILSALPIGDFGIKLNHRGLLDAILDICGVPAEKFRTICSAIDKLDKEPWSDVKKEMIEEKGLNPASAEKIGGFVVRKGNPWQLYQALIDGNVFGNHSGAWEAMHDLEILFEYLEAMGKLKHITFDLSLARGLDYYTGVIYEAVSMNGNTQVGSIGGGGRYDNLVSMFQDAGKITPCVGVSVGIERVFALMEAKLRQEQGSIKQPNVDVIIAQAGDNMMRERMKVAQLLWSAHIRCEYSQQENPKLKYEITSALDRSIPFVVIVGEEESKLGQCKVKDLKMRTEETVSQNLLVSVLKQKGVIPVGCEFAMELLKEN